MSSKNPKVKKDKSKPCQFDKTDNFDNVTAFNFMHRNIIKEYTIQSIIKKKNKYGKSK